MRKLTPFPCIRHARIVCTDNTQSLYNQFLDKGKEPSRLIVTTIQKLNNVITKQQYLSQMETLKNKRIVFIFDECHRSQYGETHKRITEFFEMAQMFGFTGTPIFADNAIKNKQGAHTTKVGFHYIQSI